MVTIQQKSEYGLKALVRLLEPFFLLELQSNKNRSMV